MPKIAILILAAGASSRMGDVDKLMQDAAGVPLLTRVISRACASTLPVFVTLPDLSHPRANLVRATEASLICVPDWRAGMSASISTGVAALPVNTPGVMILPGDMPDLTTRDLQALADTAQNHPSSIIRATAPDGTGGHPVIFPQDLFDQLQSLTGDQGARAVVRAHQQRLHPHIITGTRALTDLDTPQDWATWRAAQT